MATTNIRYLQVHLAYFINLLPEAIRYHLQTCYVYGVLVTLPCTYIQLSWSLVLTLGSYRYIYKLIA